MKKSIIKTVSLLSLLFLFSCADQDFQKELESKILEVNYSSIDQIDELNLGEKFNIPEEVYQDFLANAIFQNGELAGFKFAAVDALLDNDQSFAFWRYFGIQVRENAAVERDIDYEIAERPHYLHKKPILGGCEYRWDYVCFGSTNGNFRDKRPTYNDAGEVTGCEPKSLYVCFYPD